MAENINGRTLARELNQALKRDIDAMDRKPCIVVVRVGDDPASEVYVGLKSKVAGRIGLRHRVIVLPEDTAQSSLLQLVDDLNQDPETDGILVQLPLPDGIENSVVLDAIDPRKDVDGLHPVNLGLVSQGRPRFTPCTPAGILGLLRWCGTELSGAHAVVVGRSNIVGRPVAMLLEQHNATVTLCHSRTQNLADHVRRADVLVAAVGRPRFIQGDWIKPGAVVIDVGVNRLDDGTLCGDVDIDSAAQARAITPVPGGVGPMTIAMLMQNTVAAARALHGPSL